MKKRFLTMSIVMLAVLVAFTAPVAADWAFDGFELKNLINGTVQGDVYVSNGTHAGLANTPYTTNYNVPSGTVRWARLYVGVWGGTENYVGWVNTTFNNHCEGNVTLNRSEDTNTYSSGINVYGSGHGVWMVSYNCTDNVTMGATNTAEARTGAISGSFDGRVYGIVLVVVYESSSLPKVEYWVNEGNMNLHYETGGYAAVNKTFAWFNGTAYNCTEANLTAVQYTGSDGEPDYLYFNAPDASDSPYSDNISWSISNYRTHQMDSNDVADSHSDQDGVCDDNSVFTYGFDLNCFSHANDTTQLKDIVNTTDNNYAIFWRGHDDNGDGTITAAFQPEVPVEGESYVHPIVAVLRLKNITHVYDFSDNFTGTPGEDAWAFRYQVNAKPPTTCDVPSTEFTTAQYDNIKADDGTYQSDDSLTQYAAHRFNFSIDEAAADIEKINVTWNGRGHKTGGNGATLYIWNNSKGASGEYEEWDSSTSGNEITLTNETTSNISNYITSGNVTVLVEQNANGPPASCIETDYVKLVITPDP